MGQAQLDVTRPPAKVSTPVTAAAKQPRLAMGVEQDAWTPKPIRPLLIPVNAVRVPDPVTVFTRIGLRRAIKYERRYEPITLRGRVVVGYREIDGQKRPVAALKDAAGNSVWVFTAEDEFALYVRLLELRGQVICLFGRVFQRDRYWFIEHPEPMPGRWIGRPRPVYDLHAQTHAAIARRAPDILSDSYLIEAKVQNEYRRRVADDATFDTYLAASRKILIEEALKDRESRYVATGATRRKDIDAAINSALTGVHKPASVEDFEASMDRIRRMAAVSVIAEQIKAGVESRKERLKEAERYNSPVLLAEDAADIDAAIARHSANIPFPLTEEQHAAAHDILSDLASGQPMRRVLSGDVGTGKTAVYAVAVAAMIAAGHRVAVILPSSLLAAQVAEKMAEFVPPATLTLISGDSKVPNPAANLWVGTVGIQFRAEEEFDFVCVDEQQRFSRDQRECTVRDGAHILEVTATCIPRTQALMAASVLDVSRLKHCHVKKRLRTRIWEVDQRTRLYRDIAADVAAGHIVIVIYPGKEISPTSQAKIYSVEEFAPIWERQFPGRVAICHGSQSAEENQASVDAVKAGNKSILVATSIVEVGIDIAGVKRVVVVQPERFGLATLHQLRGRAARQGGEGFCDLVLANAIKPGAHARLEYLSRHSDGFKLAEYDLDDRGGGDAVIDGHKQSGKMPASPFVGYQPSQDDVSRIAAELAEVYRNGIPTQ